MPLERVSCIPETIHARRTAQRYDPLFARATISPAGENRFSLPEIAMLKTIALLALTALPLAAHAQNSTDVFTAHTREELKAQGDELLKKAATDPSGSVSITLDKYPAHFTMLAARTRSGGAEQHDHYADIFVILEGEATEVTGGTMVDKKDKGNGEPRGTRIEGGTPHVMHAGDIVHIAPGTPHQTVVAPGKTVVYYVVKIQQ
jgi:beta-galactosidase beta subunit